MSFYGRSGDLSLFVFDNLGVVVDDSTNLVVEKGYAQTLTTSQSWDTAGGPGSDSALEIAQASITDLDIHVFSSNDRLYTIPKSVQTEAKRALEWRKKHDRGGTPVGLNTARTLAEGGQIGIRKIRHIAKYFPRHEVDKKGKGWKPGEDGYPSNGRIAWALWGGDAAKRWATAIRDRDEKRRKPLRADGLPEEYFAPTDVDFDVFKAADDYLFDESPEFVARVNVDGSGINRIYMIDPDDVVFVWDGGSWDNLENVEHDILSLNSELDSSDDDCVYLYIPIDTDTAIKICALLDADPFSEKKVETVSDSEEYDLFFNAAPELDWGLIDMVMTAAGEESKNDGNYTPKERSENASRQVRDATGRFATAGSRVVVGGDSKARGEITSVNGENKTVTVKLDTGNSIEVPGSSVEDEQRFLDDGFDPGIIPPGATAGILGQPRTISSDPNARIPGFLPPLTGNSVSFLLKDWSAWVAAERELYEQTAPKQPVGSWLNDPFVSDQSKRKPLPWNPKKAPNAYNHPMLRDWLDERVKGKYPNRGWYNPIVSDPDKYIEDKKKRNQVYSLAESLIAAAEKNGEKEQKAEKTEKKSSNQKLTPETSDVPPVYMAIVAEDDPQAVMDLVSLVPASKESATPTLFRRAPGEWVEDESILSDLNSPTPPPVVVLDNDNLASVVEQIDTATVISSAYVLDRRLPLVLSSEEIISLVAAGGLDRNRGNAEKLRRYWTIGRGGAKIRWGSPGDWTRCARYLAKYMGPRSKGYCALRHKEMTGMWTGDKVHRQMYGRKSFSTESLLTETEIIDNAAMSARREDALNRVSGLTAGGSSGEGSTFFIPLVIPEGIESGDGRKFVEGAIDMRELPLPLLWQIKTGQGHDGSVVVGKITHMERTKGGIGHAFGVFDSGAYGKEAERLVRGGFIRGISADLDRFEADEEVEEASEDGSKKIGTGKINISKARVMAVTLVPKPAFQECTIQIVEDKEEQEEQEQQEEPVVEDGIYVEEVDPSEASALVACGMVAGAIPVVPPAEWFENPALTKPTPLTVDDEGRVYGHIAAWHVDHIGMSFGTRPPRSQSKYSYFHTGVVRTQDGKDVPVGQLTLAGGHASLEASAAEAVRHYDDTASAIADVHAGEDSHGIWVAGALRPGTTPEQIRALRASAPSGDWRPIKGRLELVAVCQVNVPGFPIARARVASGQVLALVAAGAGTLARIKSDPVAELQARVEKLEQLEKQPLIAAADEAKARVHSIIATQKAAELSARVSATREEIAMMASAADFADFPREERERLAKEGKALRDGSFPIRNVEDLKNAVSAYGRAKKTNRAKVRRHIIKRARKLGRPDLIPENWTEAAELDSIIASMKSKISQFADADPTIEDLIEDVEQAENNEEKPFKKSKYTAKTQPRDARGRFRQVLARIKENLGTTGNAKALKKIEEAENLDFAGDYAGAVEAADDLIKIIDRLDSGALNKESLENVRTSSAELGKVIANLPFAFGDEAQKIRFSDVPPALRDLIDDMISRVEDKIGKEDANIATETLRKFKSGSDMMNQGEISSQMAKLLRLLT